VSITPSGWHLRRPHSQKATSPPIYCPAGNQSEFYINLKSAKALGVTVPLPLSGCTEEVIK